MESTSRERDIFSFHRNDDVVNEVLESFSEKEDFYFSGGLVGVQSYIPETHFRRTSDIDMILLEHVQNNTQVAEALAYELEDLYDKGFSANFKKRRETLDINLEKDNYKIKLQTKRRNPKNFEKHFDQLFDAYLSARPVELYGVKSLVASPEHVIASKLSRLSAFNGRGDITSDMVNRSFALNFRESELLDRLNDIEDKHTDLMKSVLTLTKDEFETIKSNIRYFADMYDISTLDEFNELDEDTLNRAIKGAKPETDIFTKVIGKELLTKNKII